MIFSAGDTADSSNPARCEHRGRQSDRGDTPFPPRLPRRHHGQPKKLNIPIVVWTIQQQAAGFFFISVFNFFFFYSFQCILKSQRIPEPISLLEGGRKYKEEKRSGWVRFKMQSMLLWGCDVIEGESAAGTDSRPTWKQSVFAHWSQHCQCYFIISFIFAPIPNRFQRWTSVPLLVWMLCVSQFRQLVLVLATENKFWTQSLQKATNISNMHQTERGCTRRIKEVENFFFRFAFKSNFTLIPINVSEHERGALLTSGWLRRQLSAVCLR